MVRFRFVYSVSTQKTGKYFFLKLFPAAEKHWICECSFRDGQGIHRSTGLLNARCARAVSFSALGGRLRNVRAAPNRMKYPAIAVTRGKHLTRMLGLFFLAEDSEYRRAASRHLCGKRSALFQLGADGLVMAAR